jgi:DNA-directed RNA polymerase specialized sigma24 family protein
VELSDTLIEGHLYHAPRAPAAADALREAFKAMTAEQKQFVRLRYVRRLTMDAAARELHLSRASCYRVRADVLRTVAFHLTGLR